MKHLGEAIRADRMKVGGGVFFNRGFTADGEVKLNGAFVGGDLSCMGGTFRNLSGYAITAENITVGQSVLLFGGFNAYGKIDLFGAKISQTLNCYGGTFDFVILNEATIKGLFVRSRIQNANVVELRFTETPPSALLRTMRKAGHRRDVCVWMVLNTSEFQIVRWKRTS